MGQWIWKFGDFEIYHNLLVHNRRQQYGYPEPPVWKLYTPEPVVCFRYRTATQGGIMRIKACGDISVTVGEEPQKMKKYGGQKEIRLEPGNVQVCIRVANIKTFPCVYVSGAIESNENWEADDLTGCWEAVGTYAYFDSPQKTPEIFPFSYRPENWGKREKIFDGVLFDFGHETFAGTTITGLPERKIRVQFGESREEALDARWSVIHFEQEPSGGCLKYPPCAFRYIFVSSDEASVRAEYEYLDLSRRGSFSCNEEIINKVWETAAYTFHLNCREFFLDGIKRDRWVWAGDAYQSLFVNRYLFFDPDIEKRTLIALGGKSPVRMHINTIMDYSFLWIISLYEYYRTYGDRKFLVQISALLHEMMEFCRSRADDDGFMRGKPGDWVFIDWAPMDKTGALCAEQILYAKALECYSRICRVLNNSDRNSGREAQRLQAAVFEKFYDREKKAFIDSYESGRKNVTRQSNILAYLFLLCSRQQKEGIYKNVILNPRVPEITTPYFKFYENQVHCQEGNETLLEESIRNYYGSMLETGATTLYEAYDPKEQGAAHYAMYGNPYEKSLCHAWGASPIYLLGNYRLGVENTGIGYDTFEVRPRMGNMKEFSGKVPVPGGFVSVKAKEGKVWVTATVPGGILCAGSRRIPLKPGEEETAVL